MISTISGVDRFDWIPFYEELAQKLVPYRYKQQELLGFLDELKTQGMTITTLEDRDEFDNRFPIQEIDPFTFFGVFNRLFRDEKRIQILTQLKKQFEIQSDIPLSFFGIPVLNPRRSWFIGFKFHRHLADVDKLWDLFTAAVDPNVANPLEEASFIEAFDRALEVRYTGSVNITMGLFWIRPGTFMSLDKYMRKMQNISMPSKGLTIEFYRDAITKVAQLNQSFAELSDIAWATRGESDPVNLAETASYWLVGAYDPSNDEDQTQRFLEEGIWQNGYVDRYLDQVRSMQVGDQIAIKSVTTQKHNLPFDAYGNTVSKAYIKASGTITANHGDGRTLEVEWEELKTPKEWYFYTYRSTVWKLRKDRKMAQQLIAFAFGNQLQDYQYFVDSWWPNGVINTELEGEVDTIEPYSIEDLHKEGVFLSTDEINLAIGRLRSKRNLILQGAPGVGKTFVAKKLAYALMESKDAQRVRTVQLHPSYSYEDFIQGFRPTNEAGRFELRDGAFTRLCKQAYSDPDHEYVLIIDEINRGNLSQIFGEVFSLIENSKRGTSNSITPLYWQEGHPEMFVPENIYIIGTMNLADRSLALVDYALRRRFSFMTLVPKFDSPQYEDWLEQRGMDRKLINHIKRTMGQLTKEIADDKQLGPAFKVGHSFFCPQGNDFSRLDQTWFDNVINGEIKPLIDEYWFDDPDKVGNIISKVFG